MVGETLGQYRIEARLGAGGMGVVYRAHDERLHRTVAIKVVGQGKVTSEERTHLLDEARAASHLSHPNICTVYEAGEAGGHAFIAMEFIDGRLLSEMVQPGGLPTETVVRFGVQIADALAHAHERGVVHRDLKTANIAVSDKGPKVLDFGIARRISPADPNSETRSITPAESDIVFGTLAYVAPEVLRGDPGDARSDIWAFGVVLWEMATGELPFSGRSQFELTAAILRSPPRTMPAHVPAILRGIILRCLSKDPAQRYQRAGEARAALEAVQSDVLMTPLDAPRPRRGLAMLAVAAGLLSLFAVTAWIIRPGWRATSDWADRITAGQLTQIVSTPYRTFDPTLSPDGRMLAYVGEREPGRMDLLVGRVAGGARVQLTNDDAREQAPRFSPDGEWIAFTRLDPRTSAPEIRVLPALGGDVRAIIPNASAPAWSADGERLAFLTRAAGHAPIELTVSGVYGTDARVILSGDSVYPFLRSPAWSSDGRDVIVVRGTGGVAGELWAVPVDEGQPRRLLAEPATVYSDSPVFTPDGAGIVHTSNRGGSTNIWFLPMPEGAPVRLTTGPGPDESPSVALDGSVAFVNSRWRNTLDVVDLTGKLAQTLVAHSPFLWSPAVKPDGSEIAYSRSEVDGTWHVWTVPVGGGESKRLTAGAAGEVYPRYSPDGAWIWFHTWNAPREIGRVQSAGGAPAVVPLGVDAPHGFADVSPDGRHVAFTVAVENSELVHVAPVEGGAARVLTKSPGAVPRWSPDGKQLAFAGNRGYSGGIFVINADGSGERRLTREGGWAVWWPDGKRLGYVAIGRGGDQEVRLITRDGRPIQTLDRVKFLGTNHPFAVFPDGKRLATTNAVHLSDEIWLLQPRQN